MHADAVRSDLHIHTVYSDGICDPVEYVLVAIRKNIRVLSFTDHNTFKGSVRGINVVKDRGFDQNILVVPGSEVRTEYGDVLVLCPRLPETDAPREFEVLVDWCRERDCLMIAAHPFDVLRRGVGKMIYAHKWDLVEVFNAGTLIPALNVLSYVVSRELGIPGLSVSDAHSVHEFGYAYTYVIGVHELSVDVVLARLRGGRVMPVIPKCFRCLVGRCCRFLRKILRCDLNEHRQTCALQR